MSNENESHTQPQNSIVLEQLWIQRRRKWCLEKTESESHMKGLELERLRTSRPRRQGGRRWTVTLQIVGTVRSPFSQTDTSVKAGERPFRLQGFTFFISQAAFLRKLWDDTFHKNEGIAEIQTVLKPRERGRAEFRAGGLTEDVSKGDTETDRPCAASGWDERRWTFPAGTSGKN